MYISMIQTVFCGSMCVVIVDLSKQTNLGENHVSTAVVVVVVVVVHEKGVDG